VLLLAFTVFYKLGDWLAEAMTMPFLLRGMGFTKMQIGTVQKTTAMFAIILGGLIGGWMLMRMSLRKALWICGFVQASSILGFWGHFDAGPPPVVAGGRKLPGEPGLRHGGQRAHRPAHGQLQPIYTGTQYALFSAMTALPRTSSPG